MKNLYEQLTEENRKVLNDYEYTFTANSVIEMLKANEHPLRLSIIDALNVWTILSHKPFDLNEFDEMFNNEN